MSKTAGAIVVVGLAAGGAALWLQNSSNDALRSEITALREEVRQATLVAKASPAAVAGRGEAPGAAAQAPGPGAASEDLKQLRVEIAALRKSTSTITQFIQSAQAAQELAKAGDNVATKLTPAGELKNAGKATPAAGIETALWAAVGGDVDALAAAVAFSPSAKAKADAWFAGLSDNTRQQYGGPEKVIALMVAKDAAALAGVQVLGQKEIGPDDVGVRLRLASSDGKTKDDTLLMHRTLEGWKMLLTDGAVDKFARQLKGGR